MLDLRRRGRHSGAAAGVAVARLALGPPFSRQGPGQLPTRPAGRRASRAGNAGSPGGLYPARRTAPRGPGAPQPPRGGAPLHPAGQPTRGARDSGARPTGADAAGAHFVRRSACARVSRPGTATPGRCAQRWHVALRGQQPASAQRATAQTLHASGFHGPSSAAHLGAGRRGAHGPGRSLGPPRGRGQSRAFPPGTPISSAAQPGQQRCRPSAPRDAAACGRFSNGGTTFARSGGGPTAGRGNGCGPARSPSRGGLADARASPSSATGPSAQRLPADGPAVQAHPSGAGGTQIRAPPPTRDAAPAGRTHGPSSLLGREACGARGGTFGAKPPPAGCAARPT